jgi:hypothetical protein
MVKIHPKMNSSVGAVLLHLSMEMNSFHAVSTAKDECSPNNIVGVLFVRQLTSCSLEQREQITCRTVLVSPQS